LQIDLSDNWTITPTVMAQDQKSTGVFGYDPRVGDLKVTHFYPDWTHDWWYQAALTVQGKISDFDVTYAGAYLHRFITSELDYSDYSFWYDTLFGYGKYVTDNKGDLINPSQYILGLDRFQLESHELRIASPADDRLRFIAGLFYERQQHDIHQDYVINDLATSLSVPGWTNTIWLTQQQRVDRDYAAFGEVSFDITNQLTLTGGVRGYIRTIALSVSTVSAPVTVHRRGRQPVSNRRLPLLRPAPT
jgi:iron complex outermembrane receptor protein